MKLGDYEVPEIRLIPNAVSMLDEIYSVKKRDKVLSKDIAIHLGFRYGTEGYFYRKLKTLLAYGLLEGKGSYQVSALGETLLHPRTDKMKEIAKTKAVLSVGLWSAIKNKVGKEPREDNFWSVLVDITKITPDTAKKMQSKILKWYIEDIGLISDDLIESDLEINNGNDSTATTLRSSSTQSNQKSHQTPSLGQLNVPSVGTIEINDEDTLTVARACLDIIGKKIREGKVEKFSDEIKNEDQEVVKDIQVGDSKDESSDETNIL